MKISQVKGGTNEMPVLVDQNKDAGLAEGQSLVYLKGKLYVFKNDAEKPLAIFKADTLK